MPTQRPKLTALLPDGFEKFIYVEQLRKSLVRRLREGSPAVRPDELLNEPCSKHDRCISGLCPVCVRKVRRSLVRGCHDYQLHLLTWTAITFQLPHLVIEAGDHRRLLNTVGTLAEIPEVKRLITTLRRRHQSSDYRGPFMCIGSVEAALKIIGRERQPKQFHAHLIISGLPETVVAEVADAYFGEYRSAKLINPVHVQAVQPGWQDFVAAMTYAYKQPYIKKSFANADTTKFVFQRPKVYELVEMASNLGPHRCTDRLILAGLRMTGSKLQLTPNAIGPLERQLRINALKPSE